MALTTPAEPRVVNTPFMAGLIALPIVFVWFLLLPGYSPSLRKAAFFCTFAFPAHNVLYMVLAALLGATINP